MVRGWLLVVLLLWVASVQAMPRESRVPGGVALVDLGEARPEAVRYGDNAVRVAREGGRWYAVVGIPLDAAAGVHRISVRRDGEELRREFSVTTKQYREQRITLSSDRQVQLAQADIDRFQRERPEILGAFRHWFEAEAEMPRFIVPVAGRMSSPFGLRRFFNDQPRNPHNGLDIAAPTGTPVVAPAAGRVVTTGDYFFNGKTVFLDHGHGLVTMHCHLDSIEVQPGQTVAQGEPIGSVGMTGRATGPHLHWTVSLNDTRVDPLLFLDAEERTKIGL